MNNEPCTEKQEKHVELASAVNHIDSILAHLDELIARITGQTPDTECDRGVEAKEKRPTLSDVLEYSPNLIRTKVDAAYKKIAHINECLF